MVDTYTIGKLSKIVGLPTKTIRFYEEESLIKKATRSENGYRVYSKDTIEELKVIKYARELDLPISEIKKLLHGCCEGEKCVHSQEYLDQYIKNYLILIDKRIAELEVLKLKLVDLDKTINLKKESCKEGKYCCNIFYQIINDINKKGGDIK